MEITTTKFEDFLGPGVVNWNFIFSKNEIFSFNQKLFIENETEYFRDKLIKF
jgi:hypothetical protein